MTKLNTLMMFFEDTASTSTMGSTVSIVIMLALLGVVFYFFIYRPQKKQERETTSMRNSIEIGDVIVTTGGIIGMVVKVKDDMLLIESSGDRTKIQVQKWAVHSVIEKANEPEKDEDSKDNKDKKLK